MTVPSPRPPSSGPASMRALLHSLDAHALSDIGHTETVTDEPGGVLYLICGAGRTVRRIVITRVGDVYVLEDQQVTVYPWRVETTATRAGVRHQYVSAKLREFARQHAERAAV